MGESVHRQFVGMTWKDMKHVEVGPDFVQETTEKIKVIRETSSCSE